VRQDDVRLEVAHELCEAIYRGLIDMERIVAQVERLEGRPHRGRRGLGLTMAVPLNVLNCLVRHLPEFAGLSSFPIRQGYDSRFATRQRVFSDHTGRTPHEIGAVRTHDKEPSLFHSVSSY
jgi:hypothetical protein